MAAADRVAREIGGDRLMLAIVNKMTAITQVAATLERPSSQAKCPLERTIESMQTDILLRSFLYSFSFFFLIVTRGDQPRETSGANAT